MSKKNLIKMILQIIAVLAVVLAIYFYSQVREFKKNPNIAAQQEVASLVDKVGRLAVLPTGETPTVATVSDPEALKDQSFFAQAVKGDKVLIYAQAKKAVLYSVTMDKIIEIAPLNIGNQKSVTPPATKADSEN